MKVAGSCAGGIELGLGNIIVEFQYSDRTGYLFVISSMRYVTVKLFDDVMCRVDGCFDSSCLFAPE